MLIVVTPAASRLLSTVERLQVELGATSEPQASQVAGVLAEASAAVETHCSRTFARETVRETLRLRSAHGGAIRLQRSPIASIASITEDGAAVTADDYEYEADTGQVYRLREDRRVGWPASKIVITYEAGYILPGADGADLPADVERQCLRVAVAIWHSRNRDPLLRSEAAEGVGSASYVDPSDASGGLPQQVADALWPHVSWWAK